MRKNLLKILTLVLVLAALVSVLVVAASAEDAVLADFTMSSVPNINSTAGLGWATGVKDQSGNGSYHVWYNYDTTTGIYGPYFHIGGDTNKVTSISTLKYAMIEVDLMSRDNYVPFMIGIYGNPDTVENGTKQWLGRANIKQDANGVWSVYANDETTALAQLTDTFAWHRISVLYEFSGDTVVSTDKIYIFVDGVKVGETTVLAKSVGSKNIYMARASTISTIKVPATSSTSVYFAAPSVKGFTAGDLDSVSAYIAQQIGKPENVDKPFSVNGTYYDTFAEAEAAAYEANGSDGVVVLHGGVLDAVKVTKPIKVDTVSGTLQNPTLAKNSPTGAQYPYTFNYTTASLIDAPTVENGVYTFTEISTEGLYWVLTDTSKGEKDYGYTNVLNMDHTKLQTEFYLELYGDVYLNYNGSSDNGSRLYFKGGCNSTIDLRGNKLLLCNATNLTYDVTGIQTPSTYSGKHAAISPSGSNARLNIISSTGGKGTLASVAMAANGTDPASYVFYPGQTGYVIYMENVMLTDDPDGDGTGDQRTFSDTRAYGTFIMKNSYLNIKTASTFSQMNRGGNTWEENASPTPYRFIIDNTKVDLANGFFTSHHKDNGSCGDIYVEMQIINGSVINCAAGSFLKSQNHNAKNEEIHVYVSGDSTVNASTFISGATSTTLTKSNTLHVELGATFNAKVMTGTNFAKNCTVKIYDKLTFGGYDAKTAYGDIAVVTLGNKLEAGEYVYDIGNNLDGSPTYAPIADDANDKFYKITYNDGTYVYGVSNVIDNSLLNQKVNIKLELYKDCILNYRGNTQGTFFAGEDTTIDLMGNTLTLCNASAFSFDEATGLYSPTTFTGNHSYLAPVTTAYAKISIISSTEQKGTLLSNARTEDNTAQKSNFFFPGPSNYRYTYYCENVIFSDNGRSLGFTNVRATGDMIFKNCQLEAKHAGSYFNVMGRTGNTAETAMNIVLDNTTVNTATTSFFFQTHTSATNATANVYANFYFVNGSVINCAGGAVVKGNNPGANYFEVINVYVSADCVINAKEILNGENQTNENASHQLHLTFGTKFNHDVEAAKTDGTDLKNASYFVYDSITFDTVYSDGIAAPTLGTPAERHLFSLDNESGAYVLILPAKPIYTVSLVLDGRVVATLNIMEGDKPELDGYTLSTVDCYKDGNGVVYVVTDYEGWAVTDGGDALTEYPAVEADTTFYMVGYTGEAAKYAWFDSQGGLVGAVTATEITNDNLALVTEGGTLVLYSDVSYLGTKVNIQFNEAVKNVTLDLNKYTFTKNGANATSGEDARINLLNGQTVTVKNGTVVTDAENFIFCQVNATANVENVTINSKAFDTGKLDEKGAKIFNYAAIFDFRAGTLNVTDCTINSNTGFGNSAYRGGSPKFTLTRVEINVDLLDGFVAEYVFGCNPRNNDSANAPADKSYVAKSSHTLIDCKINAPEVEALYGVGGYIGATSTPSLKVIDCEINCKTILTTTSSVNTTYAGSYYFENSKLSAAPVATIGTVSYKAGEILVTTDGEFANMVTAAPALSVNLTLYTDINFNLYIPTVTNITKVTIGGTEYVISEALPIYTDENGNTFYKLSCTAAAKAAAEDVTVEVTYTVDGVNCVATTNFSTVDYAEQVLASTDAEVQKAQKLTNAIVNYIDNAYTYFGTTNANGKLEALKTSGLYTKPTLTAPEQEADTTALAEVIESAYFSLHTDIRLVLKVKEAALSETFTVKVGDEVFYNGKAVDGKVTVSIRANYLVETITISTANVTGTYSFANYATAVGEGAEENLANMLNAIYAYAYEAYAYKNPTVEEQ